MTNRTMQGISRRTFLGTAASAGAAAGVFTAGAAPAIAQAKPTVLKWAHVYEVSEPYQQTVGQLATIIRSTSGQEPTEPHQVARIVRDLAGRDDAPVRLLIGADAYQYGQEAAKALAESDETWRGVTESTSRT